MRRLTPLLATLVLVPVAAFALDFTQSAVEYTDFRSMTLAEKAAVSVLSNEDIVRGNPDGSFSPRRTLNRAEFLAIAQRAVQPELPTLDAADLRCFPDVASGDWFATAVCWAESKRIIQGYPDGLFHPERDVNYAEAVKILVGLYEYELPDPEPNERWAWYTPYLRTAETRGVTLSETPSPETFITRGQMARLAAAFVAESQGQLAQYRATERGDDPEGVSSSSVSSQGESSSSVSVSVSESSLSASSVTSSTSSSTPSRQRYPAVSRQIYLGTRSLPIADGIIRHDVGSDVRLVNVRFATELQAVSGVFLMDGSGKELVALQRGGADGSDGKHRTWEALLPVGAMRISANTDLTLAVEVQTKTRETGGAANELIEVTGITVFAQQDSDGSTKSLVPSSTHFPQHQTVQSMITSIQNGTTVGEVRNGKKMHLASFQFGGVLQENAKLSIEALKLAVESEGVTLSNWYVATTDRPDTFICTTSGSPSNVFCDSLMGGSGNIGNGIRTLNIFADVAVQTGVTDPTVRVSLGDPGTIGRIGAITWTDGTGTYKWIDWPGTTVIQGPMWHPR